MPGMIDRKGAERSTLRPSAIIEPQVTMLGSPRPRKESAASVSTAPATMTELSASTGGSALGRISRKRDLHRVHADDAGGGDIVALADRQHLGARQPRRPGPGAERDGEDHHRQRGADDADEGQRQQEARHDLEGVDDAHQRLVDQPAGEARERADQRADDDGDDGCGDADGERGARAVHQAGQHVAAEPVGAERKARRR